jgi:hypothetical protein
MNCNPIVNPNLIINRGIAYSSNAPTNKCDIKDPQLKEFFDRIICYQKTRKGLKLNQRMGYIINHFNPENMCSMDLVELKKLYDEYACSNCR